MVVAGFAVHELVPAVRTLRTLNGLPTIHKARLMGAPDTAPAKCVLAGNPLQVQAQVSRPAQHPQRAVHADVVAVSFGAHLCPQP